jgi:hypothetical protein
MSPSKEGKDEMIKASTDLQDLRRRLYDMAKAESAWRSGNTSAIRARSESKGRRLEAME